MNRAPTSFEHLIADDGAFEVITPNDGAGRDGLVRSLSGYVERAPAASTRIERATCDVILIFEIYDPIGLQTRDGPRRFHEGGFVAGLDDLPTPTQLGTFHAGIEVRLTPRAARRLLRMPLSEVARRAVAVTDLLDGEDRHLAARLRDTTDWGRRLALVNEMLNRRLRVPVADERRVAHAFSALRTGASVTNAAAGVDLSVTHLERLFADHFGVPPSLAARLDRIDRTVAALRHHPHQRWADLAQHLGFTDQPHLAREVKRLTSLTPTELRASLAHPITSTWPHPDVDAK